MRKGALCRSATKCLVVLVMLLAGGRPPAEGGETTLYLKSGWYTWDEKINGADFVKEKGFLHAAGIARTDELARLAFRELLEVWGGELDFDGHDVTGSTPLKLDTVYIGTKEEFSVGVPLLTGKPVAVEPFAGVGHKFWVRTRSGEDWNLIYGKAGLAVQVTSGTTRFFARGGALLPLYARNHVDLSGAGLSDVVVEPEPRVVPFAEGGVKVGAFGVSVEYEALSFGVSPSVPTRRLAASGAVVVNTMAYQPDSDSSLVSVKIFWGF